MIGPLMCLVISYHRFFNKVLGAFSVHLFRLIPQVHTSPGKHLPWEKMCPTPRHFWKRGTLKNYPAFHWCCITHHCDSMNHYRSHSDFLMIINKLHFIF
jgi:hypothetical protein